MMNPSGDKRLGSPTPSSQAKKPRLESLNYEGMIKRPELPTLDPEVDNLIFQLVELDHHIQKVGDTEGPAPIIRIFGVTEEGYSVSCHVLGFHPYFFIKAPPSLTRNNLEAFKNGLNKALLDDMNNNPFGVVDAVKNCHFVEKQKTSCVRITLAIPDLMLAAEKILKRGKVEIPGIESFGPVEVYEAEIKFELRWMADRKVEGCSWLEVVGGGWKKLSHEKIQTRSQLEVEVAWDSIVSHQPEGEWKKVAPLRILSMDIEANLRDGSFPVPEIDPVIQIACLVVRHGEPEPFIKNVFTLKSCDPMPGTTVISFDEESELLASWATFFKDCDPDIITGYNVNHFDIVYLLKRGKKLGLDNFSFLGRVINIPSKVMELKPNSQLPFADLQKKIVNRSFNMEGRIIFDMLLILMQDQNFNLPLKLEKASNRYLGEGKEMVSYSEIPELQAGDSQTRRRLALYCQKDAALPLKLMEHLGCLTKFLDWSRASGVPLSYLSYLKAGGEQIRTTANKLRNALKSGTLMDM